MTGALLGLLAALGVAIIYEASPVRRRIRLDDRLAPYLRDSPRPSRLLTVQGGQVTGVLSPVARVLGPVMKDLVRMVDRVSGGRRSVNRRLAVLHNDMGVEDFRIEQVLWGAVGLFGGLVLNGLSYLSQGSINVVLAVVVCVGGLVSGVAIRDWWLTNEVRRREEAIMAEFPAIAEMLALAVAAGEGPLGAIDRVCRLAGGELVKDLHEALAQTRAGTPMVQALQDLADRVAIDSVSRFVDGLVVAIERGTPLADVLRAQAADVREGGKRALLEAGGRKEIAMMVPVVFFVLPVTVVFALYPGFISIVDFAR